MSQNVCADKLSWLAVRKANLYVSISTLAYCQKRKVLNQIFLGRKERERGCRLQAKGSRGKGCNFFLKFLKRKNLFQPNDFGKGGFKSKGGFGSASGFGREEGKSNRGFDSGSKRGLTRDNGFQEKVISKNLTFSNKKSVVIFKRKNFP